MARGIGRLVVLAALGLVLLAACTIEASDEAHLCRIAAVALVPRGEEPSDLSQGIHRARDGATDVRVDYRVGNPAHRASLLCRFAPRDAEDGRPKLIRVQTEHGLLTDPSLYFLKRFWLDTPEGDRADPEPVTGSQRAITVPFSVAYGFQVVLNALPSAAAYGMLAAAYSLVYGLIGRVNLAFGQMAAVGGAGAIAGAALLGRADPLALVLAAMAGAVWAATLHGLAMGRWVFLPLRRSTAQQGLVATVGLALVLDEYLRIAQGSAPPYIAPLRTVPLPLARSGDFIVTVTPLAITLSLGFLLVACGILLLMSRTQFGRNWRAMADDPGAAALMGVDPVRMLVQTFGLASGLAGAAGAAVVLVYGSFGPSLGTSLGLKALLAAVLGGIGSVRGAFLGGMVLGLIEAGWSAFYSIDTRDLATFAILAVALIARPGGILGFADLAPRRV